MVPDQSEFSLVSFQQPPVSEVALTVQFENGTVDLEMLGLFARAVREQLPGRETHPVAPPMEETFDVAPAPQPFEIRIGESADLPRSWFLSEDGVYLIQLQHDRITLNWRVVVPDSHLPYPRYHDLRKRFEQYLEILRGGAAESDRTLSPNMAEVTYINPIEYRRETEEVPSEHPDLATIINRVRPRPEDAFLPNSEDAQLHGRWRITGEDIGRSGESVGRLLLSAQPAFRPTDQAPIYLVTLTGRVIPNGSDTSAALLALDLAHRWVVLGFRDLTTKEMHAQWGLES